jgi:hypothetical protein
MFIGNAANRNALRLCRAVAHTLRCASLIAPYFLGEHHFDGIAPCRPALA